MKNITRRNFLKAAVSLASLFVPKGKVELDTKPNIYAIVDETLPGETVTEWQRYPAVSEWISVKDRVPTLEDGCKFLTYSTKWGYCMASVSLCDGTHSITHWQLLPGPPSVFDLLSDFNETVQGEADIPKHDQVDSFEVVAEPELWENFSAAFDACDCQFDVQVHYEQCETES